MSFVTPTLNTTYYTSYPSFQGSTLHTWIGFKRLMYLVEEAVVDHFRQQGYGPHQLYHQYGLCLEIVDSTVRIFHPVHVDDQIKIEVAPAQHKGAELRLNVRFLVERDGKELKPLSGQVLALLRLRNDAHKGTNCPVALITYVHGHVDRATRQPADFIVLAPEELASDGTVMNRLGLLNANSFVWQSHIPYYYCHYWDRIQHSGYVAMIEAVVPLFLAKRGISIKKMLETRGWIPVVSKAKVEILQEATMEEEIYTVYTVEEIFKDLTYTARMDCYVPRDNGLLRTASGCIVHGYAQLESEHRWSLAHFDTYTRAALEGRNL
jgi:acyl-CoA thioesterase FadM